MVYRGRTTNMTVNRAMWTTSTGTRMTTIMNTTAMGTTRTIIVATGTTTTRTLRTRTMSTMTKNTTTKTKSTMTRTKSTMTRTRMTKEPRIVTTMTMISTMSQTVMRVTSRGAMDMGPSLSARKWPWSLHSCWILKSLRRLVAWTLALRSPLPSPGS
jgi:hypothetical protein